MLLEEVSSSDLTLLAKALSQMEGLLGWTKLDKKAYNVEALKEAVHLYNWALHENGGSFN